MVLAAIVAGLFAGAPARLPAQAATAAPASGQARLRDGRVVAASLVGDEAGGFRLVAADGAAVALDQLDRMTFETAPNGQPAPTPTPASRLVLGLGGRISGSFAALDPASVLFRVAGGDEPIRFGRAGVRAITARPGEVIVLSDTFASIDSAKWTARGPAEAGANHRPGGGPGLRLGADASVASVLFAEPLGAGRLELDWFDPGTRGGEPDADAGVELVFRGPDGLRTVRIGLVTQDESPVVKCTGGGPSLAVQRLLRIDGWRRLLVAFDPDRTQVLIDDAELAHGEGPGGPLAQVRLVRGPGPRRARVDQPDRDEPSPSFASALRLTRSTRAVGMPESEPSRDEVMLVSGDQLFGEVPRATPSWVEVKLDPARPSVRLPWADLAGVYLRRVDPCAPSETLSGLWARVLFQPPGMETPDGPDVVEGVLTLADATTVRVRVPYGGEVAIPRARLIELQVLGGRARRVIDVGAYHLGSSVVPDLDPPQPEGPTLEKVFTLDAVPASRPISLAVDVVGVVGEEGDPDFSDLVRAGELITRVRLNGMDLGTLNALVRERNDRPLRVRITLPDDALKAGPNTLRFEQTGTKDDPNRLDNLGILGIAVEWPLPSRGGDRP
jgi:hypothetical protein